MPPFSSLTSISLPTSIRPRAELLELCLAAALGGVAAAAVMMTAARVWGQSATGISKITVSEPTTTAGPGGMGESESRGGGKALSERGSFAGPSPTDNAYWPDDTGDYSPGGHAPLRVVLIASGSVAAVKVPELCMALRHLGMGNTQIIVILTSASQVMVNRVTPNYASADLWNEWEAAQRSGEVRILEDADEWEGYDSVSQNAVVHIELRRWAHALLVAPCSANTLAKTATGLCDNLASCLLRAWDFSKPLIIAPAMNTIMWEHPITNQHIRKLEWWGASIVEPVSKKLACGDVGSGALATVQDIVSAVKTAVEKRYGHGNPNGSHGKMRTTLTAPAFGNRHA
mmetsp:Transcript_89110/g.195200  ORF Transcript_89110/g.195200 Transcript_89110/m.195200 type:complete len:344 (+) Transcript_89110:205-1236(+)